MTKTQKTNLKKGAMWVGGIALGGALVPFFKSGLDWLVSKAKSMTTNAG